MSQRLIPVLRQTMIYTCVALTPATLWTITRILLKSTEEPFIQWAERSGALMMSPDQVEQWWRIFVAPLLHHNAHHLISNAVMIILSALILAVIVKRQRLLQASSQCIQPRSHPLIWMYLTIYMGATLIALSRVLFGDILGITQGSMGLSGGAILMLSSLCVQVSIAPDLLGVNLKVTPRRDRIFMSCLWMSIPLLLLIFNQGPQVDEWSHWSAWIMGISWGVVQTTGTSITLPRRSRIMYSSMIVFCMFQVIAVYLCLTTTST